QSLMSNMAAYWWLGLLAQFYLCFPLLMKVYHRFGPARACLGIMAAFWTGLALLKGHVLYWQDSSLGWLDYMIYFNIPARLPEFAIGMWLAAAWRENHEGPARRRPFDPGFMRLGIGAAVFFLIGLMLPELPLPLGLVYNAARCLTFVGLVFVLPQADRWGAYRPVAFIAGASYSIYLIHQPLQGFMHEVFKSASPQAEFILQSSITGLLVIALAVLLDRAVQHVS
ncbi:MAG: acyltransferase family protein, partial [Proteobacteria bacterium]|nr:acyltransferase family protein [Pseudomonadota bacterium]